MGKDVSFKNRDRIIQLGISISSLRKLKGLSQEGLAEKAETSRSMISAIEAPGMTKNFSLEILFNISDALDIAPADLINSSIFPIDIIKKGKDKNA